MDRENQEQPKGRVEDPRLITGAGRYVDDIKFEHQAYLGIIRSPYAHAKIKKIDFSKAAKSPDFIASLTGEELLKLDVSPLVQFPMQKPANRSITIQPRRCRTMPGKRSGMRARRSTSALLITGCRHSCRIPMIPPGGSPIFRR